jgi:hypothetical protein
MKIVNDNQQSTKSKNQATITPKHRNNGQSPKSYNGEQGDALNGRC